MQKILIITPYAGRTGSEMMIGYLLRHFDRSKFKIAICALRHGELLNDLPEDVSVFIAPHNFTVLQKVKHRFWGDIVQSYFRKIQNEFQAEIWYFNTLVPSNLLPLAKEIGVKTVVHFHELPTEFVALKAAVFQQVMTETDMQIGCSQPVYDILEIAGGKNVKLCHEFIDPEKIQPKSVVSRANLGIGEDTFIWVMSGQSSVRKGFDFLPEIALQLRADNVKILWVGQLLDDGFTTYVSQKIKHLGLENVLLTGVQKENYYDYLALADGFVLTSREDPFPLVLLEAATLGKPIVAFPSGGVSELVLPGMGEVSDSWNMRDLAQSMRDIQSGQTQFSPEISKKRAAEFTVQTILPRWEQLLLTLA